jgi:hypothetical protein
MLRFVGCLIIPASSDTQHGSAEADHPSHTESSSPVVVVFTGKYSSATGALDLVKLKSRSNSSNGVGNHGFHHVRIAAS